MGLINPWVLLGLIVAWGASLVAVGAGGFKLGRDNVIASQAKEDKAVEQTRQAAMEGAAEAIANIKVNHTTVVQKVRHEITEKPVYRDCVNTPDGLRYINEALTGKPQPAGGGVVPRAEPASGPVLRSNGGDPGAGRGAVPGLSVRQLGR